MNKNREARRHRIWATWRRIGNVPQTVEGWDGGCGIDYATLRSWSMLDFEGERFRAAASTQS
ncbi:hypothetical protein, partial [Burkholderia contaminans]|uniref:hypothetical protein n=1 Tax=Burkholderia contaminans TaxID=488447 RepID=UPI00265056F8